MAKDYSKDSEKVDKLVRDGLKKHGDGRIPVPDPKLYPKPPAKKDKDK